MANTESNDLEVIEQPVVRLQRTDNHRRIDIQEVQNVILIWLDSNIDECDEDCQNTITQLRCVVNDVNTFTNSDQCIKFIQSITSNKICLIVSGWIGQSIISDIHDMLQMDSIFILCNNKKRHEQWTKQWPKIKGVFTEVMTICEALKQVAHQCEQNALSISFVVPGKKLDQLDSSFMYTQILKETLLTIKFEEKDRIEYINYCRKVFADNKTELGNIQKFESQYDHKTPIWWYTYECFLYPMLNRALRVMDADIIIRMGFFINDLIRHIEQLYTEQYTGHTSIETFTVYRGQGLSKVDFNKMLETKGGLISFNNFLSTSKTRQVSLSFAQNATTNPDLVGVLFVMKINPIRSATSFASIRDVSYFQDEDEVLFSMHSIFRIDDIKTIDESKQLYEVNLSLTDDNDQDLYVLGKRIREENVSGKIGWYRLCLVLIRMGQSKKTEEIYETVLDETTTDNEKAAVYHLFGWIKNDLGKYQEAISFYEKSIAVYEKVLPSHPLILASCYNNIGMVYNNTGDYSKALFFYKKALEIWEHLLSPNHPDLASCYGNIGVVYDSMGNYTQALLFHEKSLAIQQQSLPLNHPDLAKSYNNMGLSYQKMGNYQQALLSHEKALTIQKQSLPHIHPVVAFNYGNIGLVYQRMNDYPAALSYYEKSLEILHQLLPLDHPDLAKIYNNIALVYYGMGDYEEALSFYRKTLVIQEQSLSPIHPDLAKSYNNIGMVYCNVGDYVNALVFYEKALAIQQKSLSPNHIDVASSCSNIGVVYDRTGNYSKALQMYQAAIDIAQQSLPSEHTHLQWSRKQLDDVKKNHECNE